MKAIATTDFGAPVTLVEIPAPEPAEGEILVRVASSSDPGGLLHGEEGPWVNWLLVGASPSQGGRCGRRWRAELISLSPPRAVCGGFMPLRGADDDGGGESPREPCLVASDLSRDAREPLLQLSGAALATLSQTARRRLLATALGEPRRRRLGMRADHGALGLYLSLTLPKSRLVSCVPNFGIGAISRDGGSLALIELARPDRLKVETLKAFGGGEAEEFLLERVRGWARRGRPAESDIKITVTYEEDQSRLALRWPPISHEPR